MKYYSEDTVKGLLEQIDSSYIKELETLPYIEVYGVLADTREPVKKQDPILSKRIETLGLSRRAITCLRLSHHTDRSIYTIGQLVNLTEEQLWRRRNVGKKTLHEIKTKLAELGLSLKEFPDTLEEP